MTDTLDRMDELKRRQRELNERFEREDRETEDADLAEVLGTEAGRRLFSGIIGRGRVFGKVFEIAGGDPTRLAYETGRREFAVSIYQKANLLQPALVLKAITERNEMFAARKRQMDAVSKELENQGKE